MSNVEDPISSASIGVVTALALESAAIRAILDDLKQVNIHGRFYWVTTILGRDDSRHNIIVAECGMGNNFAAIRATQFLLDFPNVKSIVVCGIAGGIPCPSKPEDHVRLGDIVVSDIKGVVQYDLIKETDEFKEIRSVSHRPSSGLIAACRVLESDRLLGSQPWKTWISKGLKRFRKARPKSSLDVLAAAENPAQTLTHPNDPSRQTGCPRVFFGPIASANTLLKSPSHRDSLRTQFGAKAVEMESSGVQDATWSSGAGFLVVRGICDYCDANKNDIWQPYAAIVAAAYVRALIDKIAGAEPLTESTKHKNDICQFQSPLLDFTGRADEVNQIVTKLINPRGRQGNSSLLCGMGGIGKTATALKACWEAKDEFPDGQLFIDLKGMTSEPMTEADAMSYIIHSASAGRGKLANKKGALLQQYRKSLANKRILIILDNAKDESQIRSLLNPSSSVAFVITSRNALILDGVSVIRMTSLPIDEAANFLRHMPGAKGTYDELKIVAELCGCLPLALRVSGDLLRLRSNWTVEKYISILQAEQSRLQALKGKTPDRDVESVLALSARELILDDIDLASKWQMLSVFPSHFDLAAAAAVLDISEPPGDEATDDEIDKYISNRTTVAENCLNKLLDRSLVDYRSGTDFYNLHDLLRPVAKQVFSYADNCHYLPNSQENIDQAAERHAMHYSSSVIVDSPGFLDSLDKKEGQQDTSQVDNVASDEMTLDAIRNLSIDIKNLFVVLDWFASNQERYKSEVNLFGLAMLNTISRVLDYADKNDNKFDNQSIVKWKGFKESLQAGNMFSTISRIYVRMEKWADAWKYAERACFALKIHKPLEVGPLENIIKQCKEGLQYPS